MGFDVADRGAVRRELGSGETLLWAGAASRRDWRPVLLMVAWVAFTAAWTLLALRFVASAGASDGVFQYFPLIGALFFLAGTAGLIRNIRRTLQGVAYAVTDRRVMIIRSRHVSSLDLDHIADVLGDGEGAGQIRVEARDGSPDLVLRDLRDPDTAERLIRELLNARKPPA